MIAGTGSATSHHWPSSQRVTPVAASATIALGAAAGGLTADADAADCSTAAAQHVMNHQEATQSVHSTVRFLYHPTWCTILPTPFPSYTCTYPTPPTPAHAQPLRNVRTARWMGMHVWYPVDLEGSETQNSEKHRSQRQLLHLLNIVHVFKTGLSPTAYSVICGSQSRSWRRRVDPFTSKVIVLFHLQARLMRY